MKKLMRKLNELVETYPLFVGVGLAVLAMTLMAIWLVKNVQ